MATNGNALLRISLIGTLLAAGGCGGGEAPDPTAWPSTAVPSPTPDQAREDFLQALQRTHRAAYRYTVRGDLPEGADVQATGAHDPAARLFEVKVTVNGTASPSATHRIVTGEHNYLRDLDDKLWVHLDLSRMSQDSLVYFDMSDPAGLARFSSSIGSVRRTGPNAYAGRFNPEKNHVKHFIPVGAPTIFTLGVLFADFTATTDRGWITSITVEVDPKGPPLHITTEFSGHGTKMQIKAPPKAQVREANISYYE
ncbi:hypothetical protein [Catellatospora sichuanensis]|uniref:hypothetical protein n=1 Tax=Catellatospora sichuanensis TaxID=1969805 RepID=UPI001181D779|nr:hypothetical protein [Catellatospora sichuanensis]